MRLPFSDTSDSGQTVEDTETDERTVDYGTTAAGDSSTVQPTFTPAARDAADDTVPDDTVSDEVAETPTVVEPADAYPVTDEAAAPVVADADAPTASYTDEPAASYTDEPAASYTDEPVTSYTDDDTDEPAGYAAADTDQDAPVVRYAEVDTFETVQPADDSADVVTDEPATDYDTSGVVSPADTSAAPVTEAPETVSAAATAAAVPNLDQPLLSGDTELLSQWQRVQADFVDDPKIAVAGAADLVEQAGQALVDALQQRQRQMRTMWDHSAADGSAAPGESNVDTEELRQMMQRYRALFNQLYQPV
jgi:hypothetical protein